MNLFGGGPKPAPQPIPIAAPIADPAAVKQQQEQAAATQLQAAAGGRASTILNPGGQLGDPNYGKNSVAKVLGGAS